MNNLKTRDALSTLAFELQSSVNAARGICHAMECGQYSAEEWVTGLALVLDKLRDAANVLQQLTDAEGGAEQ